MAQPDVFGMGNLRLAYLHNMLHGWIGEAGDIKRVECQSRALHLRNETLTAHGKITRKYQEHGACLAALDVWMENQKGENTCPGVATVRLPSRSSQIGVQVTNDAGKEVVFGQLRQHGTLRQDIVVIGIRDPGDVGRQAEPVP